MSPACFQIVSRRIPKNEGDKFFILFRGERRKNRAFQGAVKVKKQKKREWEKPKKAKRP